MFTKKSFVLFAAALFLPISIIILHFADWATIRLIAALHIPQNFQQFFSIGITALGYIIVTTLGYIIVTTDSYLLIKAFTKNPCSQ